MDSIARTLGRMAHYTRAMKMCEDILRYQEVHSEELTRTFEDNEFMSAIMDYQDSSENKDQGKELYHYEIYRNSGETLIL